jgi:TIR domain/Jacalin-like lectin domain
MDFDVFISYSTIDKATADATCAALESAGIRCWIAPRDVRPGTQYAAAIIDAIDSCQLMVLIFSSNANASVQIHREIERAASKGVPIVPVRIEGIVPTKSMEYFLGQIHWLDALTPPLAAHLQKLIETIKAILQVDATGRGPLAGGIGQQESVFTATPAAFGEYLKKSERSPLQGLAAKAAPLALVLIGALGAAVFMLWDRRPSPAPIAATLPVPQQQARVSVAPLSIEKTGPFGGSGGVAFDDTDNNPDHLPISTIRIVEALNPGDQTQRLVGALQVGWGDNIGRWHGVGGANYQDTQLIRLESNEKIGRIDVNWMPYRYPTTNNSPPPLWIAGLAIWTNVRVYAFGNMGSGTLNQCILGNGETLLGFFGRSGSYIDQIGCVVGKPK